MSVYVTAQQAVDHLLLPITLDTDPPDPRQADLQLKLDAAEAIILDYLKIKPVVMPAAGTPKDFPPPAPLPQPPDVIAAILLQFAELYRFRGDDPPTEMNPRHGPLDPSEAGQLSPIITNILRRHRDPALA